MCLTVMVTVIWLLSSATKNEYKPEDYALWASVRGNNINIYDYDCGNKIIKTLSGRYGIYVAGNRGEFLNKGAVIFEKWED